MPNFEKGDAVFYIAGPNASQFPGVVDDPTVVGNRITVRKPDGKLTRPFASSTIHAPKDGK